MEERDGCYKVTGRTSEVINVGGLKFMASDVERVAVQYQNVELAKQNQNRIRLLDNTLS